MINSSATGFQKFRVADYTVSKHGAVGLLRGLAPVTFPHLPLRLNIVAPDWTLTSIIDPEFVKATESLGSVWQTSEAVARSAGLLMADEKRHGQIIFSKGGEFQEVESVFSEVAERICGEGPSLDHAVEVVAVTLVEH